MAQKDDPPSAPGCPFEMIAQAYLQVTEGDEGQTLRCAITDALSDLMSTNMRARGLSRLISRGYGAVLWTTLPRRPEVPRSSPIPTL